MKVTVKQADEVKEYPNLGISSNGTIVYFTSHGIGLCINSDGPNIEGDYSEGWDMKSFAKFNGEIVLSND